MINRKIKIGKPSPKSLTCRSFSSESNSSNTMTNPGGGHTVIKPPVSDNPILGGAAISIVDEIISKISSGGSGASACCAGTCDLSEIEEIVL